MNKPEFIYKLTNQSLQTHNGFQYKLNRWTKVDCDPEEDLCSPSWLHAYEHPLIAVLMNPIHANIESPRLFKCKWRGKIRFDNHSKLGVSELILKEELDLPTINQEQRVEIAIRCALHAYDDPDFVKWANDWLSGNDRSASAAWAAWAASAASSASAAWAARAASSAWAAWAARAAAWAASAASSASSAASAAWAAESAAEMPLLEIIQSVVE